jgi:hypothetical protein
VLKVVSNLTNIQAAQRAQATSKLTYKRCPARPPEPLETTTDWGYVLSRSSRLPLSVILRERSDKEFAGAAAIGGGEHV